MAFKEASPSSRRVGAFARRPMAWGELSQFPENAAAVGLPHQTPTPANPHHLAAPGRRVCHVMHHVELDCHVEFGIGPGQALGVSLDGVDTELPKPLDALIEDLAGHVAANRALICREDGSSHVTVAGADLAEIQAAF